MTVSIIVINFNTFEITCNCIRSVIDNAINFTYEIILVDNFSTECNPAMFKEKFPSVKLITNKSNSGFAEGNNLGISNASGTYILLLNSDTFLTENSIKKCLAVFNKNKDIAVLGCRMVYPNGEVQHSARRFRTINWEIFDLLKFALYLMPYPQRSKKMLGKYFRHDEDIECDWVNGAFFMFPKIILDNFPQKKLDNRFFMYGEDQLWCWQIKKEGYKIFFYSGTTIVHINSGSTKPGKILELKKIMMKNELIIVKERLGTSISYEIFKIIFLFKEYSRYAIKWVYWILFRRLLK
ncbi:MAG: glycosyltransferase family 2 protein [Chitinophagaceae bacterium]|jgi:hypothetical protein|nr:glycosyltransferase family 2 protein [Chitinophagaceae bacterium]MBP6987306.1 glycosyltransferase family 2 protein [Ferruginibacter sp.]MBK7088260.1 glycosyltransferase family 2 protein [Chitinophagaceae bacterium]MBK8928795.1 glycosyltransferase family 2 protein [Chitinophagaceae bacterium]MBL0253791.1 glycosyltransferase family 2 protein [Chitinophagaceae bacterium]